jgi:hypothetical protein
MLESLLFTGKGRRGGEPGPKELVAGNAQLGYYGVVDATEFITGDELAALVGLTSGTAIPNTGEWLKFAYKGKILYVAKQPFRNFISGNQLAAANIVNGNRQVTWLERNYLPRLLFGGASTPGNGSEWNDLIYRVHVNDPTGTFWEQFTNEQLVVGVGNGRTTWCQEVPAGSRVYRGYASLTEWTTGGLGSATATTGWRPVMELVP